MTGSTRSAKKIVNPGNNDQLDEGPAIGYLTVCLCPLPPMTSR
jgi:hypothetical protein